MLPPALGAASFYFTSCLPGCVGLDGKPLGRRRAKVVMRRLCFHVLTPPSSEYHCTRAWSVLPSSRIRRPAPLVRMRVMHCDCLELAVARCSLITVRALQRPRRRRAHRTCLRSDVHHKFHVVTAPSYVAPCWCLRVASSGRLVFLLNLP
eukprot:g67908.t1